MIIVKPAVCVVFTGYYFSIVWLLRRYTRISMCARNVSLNKQLWEIKVKMNYYYSECDKRVSCPVNDEKDHGIGKGNCA